MPLTPTDREIETGSRESIEADCKQRMLAMIARKREGKEHGSDEIYWLVNYLDYIPDYQLSAWLMAVCCNGLSKDETRELTKAMAYSGHVLTLKRHRPEQESIHYDPNHPELLLKYRGFVDKHSTGGVGDKVSLVLSPLLASIGFTVSKFSGRSLGHTGGTIDKLEAIPGFNTAISMKQFEKQIDEIGIALGAQTLDFAPADKRLYSLRDRSGTVESIPLIASSVMSKKIAGGADIIILDVKVGSGAFMKDLKSAEKLGKEMKAIGDGLNLQTKVLLTNMDQPLGYAVGNGPELLEAIEMLEGKTLDAPTDFHNLVMELAETIADKKELEDALRSGKAFVKFIEFLEAQGGETDVDKIRAVNAPKYSVDFEVTEDAWIKGIDAEMVGRLVHELGYTPREGSEGADYDIDNSAGMILHAKIGEHLKAGDKLYSVQGADEAKVTAACEKLLDAYLFSKSKTKKPKLVYKKIL